MSRYLDRFYTNNDNNIIDEDDKEEGNVIDDERIKVVENWVKWAVSELDKISFPSNN